MVQLHGLFRTEVMGRNIGKMVPTSKRMIKWGFIINMKKVEVVLKHSTVSGKRLIRVNEVVIHESRGLLKTSFSTSFTVDNYLMEISFVKENGDYIYDLFVDGIPYMNLMSLFDLDEEDRLCIERGEIPKKKKKHHKVSRPAEVLSEGSEDDDDNVEFEAPIERRMLNRKHRNYLSSQGFGMMSEDDMSQRHMFDHVDEKLTAMHVDKPEDAEVDVSDVDNDWEEEAARSRLKDLSKKLVVPERQKKVKVFKPKYKKMNGEVYGQLK